MTVKVLTIYYDRIDCDRYLYPEGIETPEAFAAYLERNAGRFIPMRYYSQENCVFPYYIAEDIKTKYLNVGLLKSFEECDVTVLTRVEYELRLEDVAEQICVNCVNYIPDEGEECERSRDIRGMVNLDGECWGFEKKRAAQE